MPMIAECLRKRFAPPEWGLLFEVHNRTGYASRSADALAMNLWPSRGLALHGIEVKEDRGDWLRELKNPAKSAAIQKYCDYWWLVTEPDIVHNGELPVTWGHLQRNGKKLACVVKAPKLAPAPVTKDFLAAVFRRLAEAQEQWIPKSSIAEQIQAARDEVRERADIDGDLARMTKAHDALRDTIEGFEEASGVKITPWDCGKVGDAVRTVLDGNVDGTVKQLGYLANQAEAIGRNIRRSLKEI